MQNCNLSIIWSNINIILILIFNYLYCYYGNISFYNISISILFMYLFFDTLMMIYSKKPFDAFIAHHIIGMLSVIISSQYNVSHYFSKYINFEISTIFLNYYLIKKDSISKFLFFSSFTLIRIIYGTSLMFDILRFNQLLSIIVIPFHAINYYWYYRIINKILQRSKNE